MEIINYNKNTHIGDKYNMKNILIILNLFFKTPISMDKYIIIFIQIKVNSIKI